MVEKWFKVFRNAYKSDMAETISGVGGTIAMGKHTEKVWQGIKLGHVNWFKKVDKMKPSLWKGICRRNVVEHYRLYTIFLL